MHLSTTRNALFTLAALGLAAFAAHPASAQTTITGLFDTGVNASGFTLPNGTTPDLHYTLTYLGANGTSTPVAVPTEIRTSAGGYPIGPYISDSNTSAFIGPAGSNPATYDLSGPAGIYSYTTTFNVSGVLPGLSGSSIITGNWATDNIGNDILINGVSTGNKNTTQYASYTPFTVNATNLTNGTNTLTFLVNNLAGPTDNPTALRVDGIKANGPVSPAPEPSQVGMLALAAFGLGALAFKARKRSTAQQTA